MNARFEPGVRAAWPDRAAGGQVDLPPCRDARRDVLGSVRVENYLQAADTRSTLEAVRALGALVEERDSELIIRGTGLREARETGGRSTSATRGRCCGCCRAGWPPRTGARFALDGDDSIRRRPVDRVAVPLRLMGARLRPARAASRP